MERGQNSGSRIVAGVSDAENENDGSMTEGALALSKNDAQETLNRSQRQCVKVGRILYIYTHTLRAK